MDNNKLYVRKIFLKRDKIESFDSYPFNIEVIKNFDEIELNSLVTFFVGENGTGKSTLIEAIAVVLGLNPEGGTENFQFKTSDTHSILSNYIGLKTFSKPIQKFFLRAESFYNFSTEVNRLVEEDHFLALRNIYGTNLHECSHGESFIQLVQNKFVGKGLYILDEPEAALSPQRQLSLLCLINDLVRDGAQFIIATHSSILISYRDGEILDLNNNFKKVKYEETDIYDIYKMYLSNPEGMQKRLFD